MSKRNKSSAPRRKKQGSLTYQIKHLELSRKEKKDTPMLKKTENQYKKHALKYAEWAKSTCKCKTLDDCSAHIQDYADFLVASGKTPSTIHTYLASICRVFDIPLSDIKKPIRVTAENTRSRGIKAVDERKDAGRDASPRLYDFASIVGIRRNEYLHLRPEDLVVDDFGNPCILVRKGKGGKRQLQRILLDELELVKAVFDHPADEQHLFSKAELTNKIDLHHLRALRAQRMYKYYLEHIQSEKGYREQLISEIKHTWEKDDDAREENGYHPKRWKDCKVNGNYVLRGHNRELALKNGLPVSYDRLALLAVSICHLAHWRHDVTVANYLLAI